MPDLSNFFLVPDHMMYNLIISLDITDLIIRLQITELIVRLNITMIRMVLSSSQYIKVIQCYILVGGNFKSSVQFKNYYFRIITTRISTDFFDK